jgi:hypothetical protein
MTEPLREYWVALGWQTDTASFRKMQDMLRNMSKEVEKYTVGSTFGIGPMFLKAAGLAASAITAIDFSLIGVMTHTANSDLQMQSFARRMFMSTQAARDMKMATDALGVSLEDIIWGPPELRERYQQLIKDQQRMGLGQDWEGQMRRIRDVEFQFTRLWVEAQRFTMMFAGSLSKVLFGDQGDLEANLKMLNEKFISKMPQLADDLATKVAPILRTTWELIKGIASAGKDAYDGLMKIREWTKSGDPAGAAAKDLIDPNKSITRNLEDLIIDPLTKFLGTNKQEYQNMARAKAAPYGAAAIAEFLALLDQETGGKWNIDAQNPRTGAFGLGQVMPRNWPLGKDPSRAQDQIDVAGDIFFKSLMAHGGDARAALNDYYGHGKVPPGEPTFDQYYQQWQSRVGKFYPGAGASSSWGPGSGGGDPSVQPQAFHGDIHVYVQHANATAEEIGQAVKTEMRKEATWQVQRRGVQYGRAYNT